MRKRKIAFLVRLSEKENERLQKHVQETGLSREVFLRSLIAGYQPKPLPPLDYYTLLRELQAIGNNLNQLAIKANVTEHIDTAVFKLESSRLRRAVQDIQEAFTTPERRTEVGDNSDLGREGSP